MAVRDSWPYVDAHHPNESDEHVRLKNLAVYWLLSRGFSTEDIEDEHPIDGQRKKGMTDIFADDGSVRVYIECDAVHHKIPSSMSKGGRIPAKRREAVFVFRSDGIYRVDHETRTFTCHIAGRPDLEREVPVYTYVSELPMLDLRAYK